MRRFCRTDSFLEKCSSLHKLLCDIVKSENVKESYRVVAKECLDYGRRFNISSKSINDNLETHWLGFASVNKDYINFVTGAIPYWKSVRSSYGGKL